MSHDQPGLWDDEHYPDQPGFVAGSDTSRDAAEALLDVAGKRSKTLILLRAREPHGLTSDELEQITGWLHQSASARLRELVLLGFAYDSDVQRLTRNGRRAVVRRAVRRATP